MERGDWLATRFEQHRADLQAVAYRMLGSLSEAEDAVQESWLRLSRADVSGVENLAGWLRTVVARVCLDLLRSRAARREEPLPEREDLPVPRERRPDPEQETLLADSVGLALLVVLEKLSPAERVAFVLHDMFAVPFEEIAPIVGRSLGRPGSWPAGLGAGCRGRPGCRPPSSGANAKWWTRFSPRSARATWRP